MIANTPAAWSERAQAPASHEAVLWSEQGQRERFQAVLEALNPHRGETLLDFGCGTGALAEHLPPEVHYVGYDWSVGMIERAKIEHPAHTFVSIYPTASFDLIAVIGTFNLADRWSRHDTWCELSNLWSTCRRAMAVSLYCGDDPNCIRYEGYECAEFVNSTHGVGMVTKIRENDWLLSVERR